MKIVTSVFVLLIIYASSYAQASFKVAAYLVCDNGTISDVNILNNAKVTLWNTIIGEGEGSCNSSKTKVVVTGGTSDLEILIMNGAKNAVQRKLATGKQEFIIKDTGCEKLVVVLKRGSKVLYRGKADFACGE